MEWPHPWYVTLHLDEVDQSNAMDPLEDCCDPEKMHIFQRPGRPREQCNEYSQIVFIDCSCFRFAHSLIGPPGGLLLLVSHLFAGSICGWSGL
jgi:hypothetical protein